VIAPVLQSDSVRMDTTSAYHAASTILGGPDFKRRTMPATDKLEMCS